MTTAIPPGFVFEEGPSLLPAGYGAAPISPAQAGAVLKVCVVVRLPAGSGPPPATPFVVLRELMDARVYLGCVSDVEGRVHRWVEVWVQDVDGLSSALPVYREALTNRVLDDRWAARARSFDRLGPGGIVRTGLEGRHSPPIFIDVPNLSPVTPIDRVSQKTYALCTDDKVLQANGLPAYGPSLQRFLFVPELGEKSGFLPANRDAGLDSPQSLAEQLGMGADCVALNPGGGLMMVTPFAPLSYEAYLDALGGTSTEGVTEGLLKDLASLAARGRSEVMGGSRFGTPVSGTGAWSVGQPGLLMLGEPGRAGRLVEVLHLKLRLLGDVISAVRSVTMESQAPLLNISPSSFRVRLGLTAGSGGPGLPYLWTARGVLVDPGVAVELPIKTTDASYYLAPGGDGPSIFAAQVVGRAARGKGLLRIRRVSVDGGETVLEGTITSSERLSPGRNDLVWLRFAVQGSRFDLYGVVDEQRALAGGEMRFRTLPQRLDGAASNTLKQSEGIPIPEALFELVPLLSSPCDLYSLAVLTVRTLLVDGKTTLAIALDEAMSLAYEANSTAEDASADGASKPMWERIKGLFGKDPRWRESLGPQRLVGEGFAAEEALEVVPPELWCRVLAMLVRMFPGIGPESRCRDFGDAPLGGIHKVYDKVSEDLSEVLVKSRGLIVSDQRANREVAGLIESVLSGL